MASANDNTVAEGDFSNDSDCEDFPPPPSPTALEKQVTVILHETERDTDNASPAVKGLEYMLRHSALKPVNSSAVVSLSCPPDWRVLRPLV